MSAPVMTDEHRTDDDPRFTFGLIHDVFAVLERHGYRLPAQEPDRARGAAVAALLALTRAYEGGDPS